MAFRLGVGLRERTFRQIYQTNGWNGEGTRAGPGSSLRATGKLAKSLLGVMEQLGAQSILDAGCSDSLWMPELPGYVGIDIVPEAVEAAQGRWIEREFHVADMCVDDLPSVDLVFCRDALQHMSFEDGLAAIANFKRCGATWIITSSHKGHENVDVKTGEWYAINVQSDPFNFGEPVWSIGDGTWDRGLRWPEKVVGAWRL